MWRSFLAVFRKEFLHILRDAGTLRLALMLPVMQLVLFGFIDQTVHDLPTTVVDQDHSVDSRLFRDQLKATKTFKIIDVTTDPEQARSSIDYEMSILAEDLDLQQAALSLFPPLRKTLAAGVELGALGALVSGSGPTCVFLAASAERALDLAVSLSGAGVCRSVARVTGPVPGAAIVPAAK